MVARCLNKLLMDIQVGMMGQMGVSLHSFCKIFFPHRLGSMEQEKQMRTNIGVHMCIVILHFKACSGPQSSDQWISKTCCRLVLTLPVGDEIQEMIGVCNSELVLLKHLPNSHRSREDCSEITRLLLPMMPLATSLLHCFQCC